MTPAELLPQVYDELRRLAAAKLAGQSTGHTLDATALVHEAWLKLEKASFAGVDQSHYIRVAAAAMRQILVDRARANRAVKRDHGPRVELPDVPESMSDDELIAIDEALTKLATIKSDHARLIELRFFTGMTVGEAAQSLDISTATAERMWRYARTWLEVELSER